ncbi:MAG: ribose-phosphate pyrophosphokinase-like domain-containing protein, partial [Actinomycetales bacterium]|nr:ribose-phosphate pyrophosphokinase-like domain-containing protein [Actinomycetales bacterium]
MTEIVVQNKKKLVLVSGRAHPELAEQVAFELGCEVSKTDLRTFANGE